MLHDKYTLVGVRGDVQPKWILFDVEDGEKEMRGRNERYVDGALREEFEESTFIKLRRGVEPRSREDGSTSNYLPEVIEIQNLSYKSRRGTKKVKHRKVRISGYIDWYSNVQGMWERSGVLSYA